MILLTIVEDYVLAALKHAVPEELEDGTIAATVPDAPGVIAFGADRHDCARDLFGRIEDWVRVSLTYGYQLPVLDGIDLNAESSSILATYGQSRNHTEQSAFFENEEDLFSAFAACSDTE